MTGALSPVAFQYLPNTNNTGAPASGFKLFTYVAGTSTKQSTYTDSTLGTPNANPILLDANGFVAASASSSIWLDPTLVYKLVWAPANDTDPPSSPIRSIDNVRAPIDLATLTQALVGSILYPRTTTEIAASLTIVNGWYPPGLIDRYGTNTTPGTTDMTTAITSAIKSGALVTGIQGSTYYVSTQITYTGKVMMDLRGVTITSNVLTFKFTDASGSRIRGPKFLPLTVPYTIVRNPSNWTNVAADVKQQNYQGYMPTSQDTDIWASLSPSIQNQLSVLKPGMYFTVSSAAGGDDIEITNVTGYCTSIIVEGYINARIHDNNFGGNGGTYGGIVVINGTPVNVFSTPLGFSLPRGQNNRIYSNTIRFTSLSGVVIFGQDDYAIYGNDSGYNGESGYKTYGYDGVAGPSATTATISTTGRIVGNKSGVNYYDGFDLQSFYPPITYSYIYVGTIVSGNISENNRHTGAISNGASFVYTGNHANSNGTHGLSVVGSNNTVVGNHARNNCTTGVTLIAQPFDIFMEGDDGVSYSNNVMNASAPATYNYFHAGLGGGSPTASHEGLDFGNYCDQGIGRMYIDSSIPAAKNGIFVQQQLKGTAYLQTSALPAAITATTYTVGTTDSDLSFFTSAACTVTMPAPASYPGREIHMRNTAAFAINSASANIGQITGGAPTSAILGATSGKWCRLKSDGATWIIMASN